MISSERTDGLSTESTPDHEISAVDLFVSYAPVDELFLIALEKSLALSRRKGVLRTLHRGVVTAGMERDKHVAHQLDTARIVVLLLSSDFFASDDCYEKELLRAIDRHHRGAARVIPVLVRACDLVLAPIAGLPKLPRNGIPIAQWHHPDDAWTQVASEVRAVASALLGVADAPPDPEPVSTHEERNSQGKPKEKLRSAPVVVHDSGKRWSQSVPLRLTATIAAVALLVLAARQLALSEGSRNSTTTERAWQSTASAASTQGNAVASPPSTLVAPTAEILPATPQVPPSLSSHAVKHDVSPTVGIPLAPNASSAKPPLTAQATSLPATSASTATNSEKRPRCYDATHCY